MTPVRRRALAAPAVLLALGASVAACAPSVDTDDSGSIAVVEEFLAHLEAGEATAAAALTDMEFSAELVDDDFYAASAAIPRDARIVSTEGYDGAAFRATVEYVLDDPARPESLEVRVREDDGAFAIAGWTDDLPVRIGPYPAAGVVEVNGEIEYTLADEGNELLLLPGLYTLTYLDPTRLLQVDGVQDPSFTLLVPSVDRPVIVPGFLPDVVPAISAELDRLQAACQAEGFTGPSCPAELVDAMALTPVSPSANVLWFAQSGPELVLTDGGYELHASYLFESDELPRTIDVSYSGAVTRDASGAVVLTR